MSILGALLMAVVVVMLAIGIGFISNWLWAKGDELERRDGETEL